MQPAGSQQLRQEGIINATHRGPPFACPRQKDHTCYWRKAAVRLDVIIAGNVQDVKRPACCFQQALQSDPYLPCFISWEPVKLNTPTEKWSFFCLFFFSPVIFLSDTEGRLNCCLFHGYIGCEACAVVLVFNDEIFCVCLCRGFWF